MLSLRYQATRRFLQENEGKSKSELLSMLSQMQNPDIVDDIIFYLANGYLPREPKRKIRRLYIPHRNPYLATYCCYLYGDYRYLTFYDDPNDQGQRYYINQLRMAKEMGELDNLQPDKHGIYILNSRGYGETHIYDKTRDCLVEFDERKLPKLKVNYEKMLPKNFFSTKDIEGLQKDDVFIDENIFSPDVIKCFELNKIIYPPIEIPQEFIS